ncbi:hypothetical protein SmJEL517_g04155 [Synchytrium microbalum]|uniref:RING-type domain-containing protein n=1 Tax=Synchytrium microbalum TaxID=1806994 RepID=A0A507BTB4_9FUNG|nr:uncharacterized protein SmJEL517_g04155 [Synchytrium microbalum]TPX32800.1 hypothetical protein SmJEL517_g04155 [Synchytrium microbalum]
MGNSQSSRRDAESNNNEQTSGLPIVNNVTVDHGALTPSGVYATIQPDYDVKAVRKLILERRIQPFYKGLADPPDESEHTTSSPIAISPHKADPTATKTPDESKAMTWSSTSGSAALATQSLSRNPSNTPSATISPPAIHTSASSLSIVADMKKNKRSSSFSNGQTPPLANGQHYDVGVGSQTLEELYKAPIECPICFLYYPKNINYTRCCEKPICTECFLQIKRLDSNFEPATCPYCVEPHFGIVYKAPTAANRPTAIRIASDLNGLPPRAMSPGSMSPSQVSILERTLREDETTDKGKARRMSYSYRHSSVVTSDEIRPDWKQRQQEAAMRAASSTRRNPFLMGPGGRSRLFRDPAEQERELAGAAAAAASLVENITQLTNRTARRMDSRDSLRLGSRRLSSSQDSNSSGSRNRPPIDSHNLAYLEAMRTMNIDIEEVMMMEAVRRSLAEAQEAAEKSAIEQDTRSLASRAAAAASQSSAGVTTPSMSRNSSAQTTMSQRPPDAIITAIPSTSSPLASAEADTTNTNNNKPITTSPPLSTIIAPSQPAPTSSLAPVLAPSSISDDQSSTEERDRRSSSPARSVGARDVSLEEIGAGDESVHRNILLPSDASVLSSETQMYGDGASMRTGHVTAFSLYSAETGDAYTTRSPPSITSQQPPSSLAPGRPSTSVLERDTLEDNASMSSTRALKSLKSEYIGSGGSVLSASSGIVEWDDGRDVGRTSIDGGTVGGTIAAAAQGDSS